MPLALRFESTLRASREEAWRWITDVRCLRQEMRPLLWMSVPRGVRNLEQLTVEPGRELFTSWLWLLGVLPIGTSRLTLREITPGQGFIEESPMTGMRLWRHERRLESCAQGIRVVDQLTVEPLFAGPVVSLFLRLLFASRHRVLRHRAARLLGA
ncbi:MAG: hypothetical protein GAK43_01054 [Stenotrophomonas maltophilia]|nr:MAG: hypothetical protein GAK43_01054 [Stenotrophomonas maltophilia]